MATFSARVVSRAPFEADCFRPGKRGGRGPGTGVFIGVFSPQSLWPALLVSQGAGLLVLVAGLQSAWWVTQWRSKALLPAVDNLPAENEPVDNLGWYERLLERIGARGIGLLKQIGAPALWLAGWSVLVLLGLEQAWNLQLPAAALGVSASVGAVLSLLLAFGLLVFERQLAQQSPVEWPEAPTLAQLTRVAIIVLVLGALCLLFAAETSIWPLRLAVLMGLLPGVVAAEFLLRAVLSLFIPRRNALEPPLLGRSVIADLLRWPPQPLLALQHELHNRFGIDLRQIWAFSYMRRAFYRCWRWCRWWAGC